MARQFNGTSDFINLGPAANLQITGDITISVMLRFTDVFTRNVFTARDQVTPFHGYEVSVGNGTTAPFRYTRTTGTDVTNVFSSTSVNYNSGAYVHCVLRTTGTGTGAGAFFKNSLADGVFNHAVPGTYIGDKLIGTNGANERFYLGDMARLAIWNKALTNVQIQSLTSGVEPSDIEFANLQLYLPLLGEESPEPDLSANGYDGVLTGTTQTDGPVFGQPGASYVLKRRRR